MERARVRAASLTRMSPVRQSAWRKEVVQMATQGQFDFPIPEGMKLIFRPFITLKNGQKLWARQCGKRAFPLLVKA